MVAVIGRRESDEEVRANIDPSMHALFNRIRGGIKGSARQSRTEAFAQYVEEHPEEAAIAAERIAEWRLKSALRPQLDFYETPSWCVRAICRELADYVTEGETRILDAGCGTGAILRTVGAFFPENEITGLELDEARFEHAAASTDLPTVRGDFMRHSRTYDVIISNPPYSIAHEFVQHAMTLAPVVCMLLRLPWLGSQRRAEWHREHPANIYVLPKRPSFTADGKTDATEYAWFVWSKDIGGHWFILEIDKADTTKRAA